MKIYGVDIPREREHVDRHCEDCEHFFCEASDMETTYGCDIFDDSIPSELETPNGCDLSGTMLEQLKKAKDNMFFDYWSRFS